MTDIAAGVVLFNPEDIARTQEGLRRIAKQASKVYVYDNSTKLTNINLPSNAVRISENGNLGIAHALNQIMRQADLDGFAWVITMDQDSIIPEGMLDSFANTIQSADESLGIVCPQVVDRRRAYNQAIPSTEEEYVTKAITSASCTSIEAWKQVGGFDEWLFIDLVDNEFCKRLIVSGYKILRLNKWVLDQEFGIIEPKSSCQQLFWIKFSQITHIKNLAKFSYKKYVSPFRVYYVHRNIIYVNRKMKKYGPVGYDSFNCKNYLGFIICYTLPSLLRAQHKGRVLSAIVHGTRDGLRSSAIPWRVESHRNFANK